MTTPTKKIRIGKVFRVALVDEGANLIPGLKKSREGDIDVGLISPLTKAGDRGLLYSIVYAPYMRDAHGHYMAPDDIEMACHTFGAEGMALDIMHGDQPLERTRAHVVESFILGGPDDRFPSEDHLGREVLHKGAWAMVTKIADPTLRKYTEFSLACRPGDYLIEEPPEGELALLKGKIPPNDMDTKELAELIKGIGAKIDGLKTTVDGHSASIESLQKKKAEEPLAPQPKSPEPKPVSTLADLRKAKQSLLKTKLLKHYGIDSLEDAVSLEEDALENLMADLDELEKKLAGTSGGEGSGSGRFFSKSKDEPVSSTERAADGLPADPEARKAFFEKQKEAAAEFNKSRSRNGVARS